MADYLGNVFADIERVLCDDRVRVKTITLNEGQMVQALRLVAEVIEAKNELVRENWRLRFPEARG